MSSTTVHARARTTPRIREEIRHSSLSERELARRNNPSRATVRKWKRREDWPDRSHRPQRMATTLSAAQAAIAAAGFEQTLRDYNRLYNHHIPQRVLHHRTPVQTLKAWQ